jgi:hypothetical protein
MLIKFKKLLKDIEYPTVTQEKKEFWNIAGILKNRLNQKLKFDTRPITKEGFKIGSFKTKADKMVFYIKDKWIIIDIEELHTYLKNIKSKDLHLNNLLNSLEWNIELPA